MNDKVKSLIEAVYGACEDPDMVLRYGDYIQESLIGGNKPLNSWSFRNRILAFLSYTTDARGYRQWQAAGRNVKKGAKAMYILAPSIRVVEDEKTGQKTEKTMYFASVPVFRYEDTEGLPLDYELAEQTKKIVEASRVRSLLAEMGIDVQIGATRHGEEGYLLTNIRTGEQRINLSAASEIVLYHELAHAVDRKLGTMTGNEAQAEVVAELSAMILCRTHGVEFLKENSMIYVHQYSKNLKAQEKADAVERVEGIVRYVLEAIK